MISVKLALSGHEIRGPQCTETVDLIWQRAAVMMASLRPTTLVRDSYTTPLQVGRYLDWPMHRSCVNINFIESCS